jgi:hypothetical protein
MNITELNHCEVRNYTTLNIYCSGFLCTWIWWTCLPSAVLLITPSSEEEQCVAIEKSIPTDANFSRKPVQNGVSHWFKPVFSKHIWNIAVGSANPCFLKSCAARTNAETTPLTVPVGRKQVYKSNKTCTDTFDETWKRMLPNNLSHYICNPTFSVW